MNKDIKMNTLIAGRNYTIQVRARVGNNYSDWSAAYTFKTITDGDPPAIPSKPTVGDYLGTIIIGWDGKDKDGRSMAADFKHVEVHVGDTDGFVPDANSLNTTLPGAISQETAISGLTMNQTYYVKFVAVDTSDNKSQPSESGNGKPKKVTGDALDNLAVEVANINFSARDIGATFAFYADEPPTNNVKEKDIWYDTNDGYKQYVYANGQWKDVKSASAEAVDQVARDKADQAQQSASGKNKITYSLNAPSNTSNPGTAAGDVWFRRNDNGVIIAQYEWTGSQWIERKIENAVIANIDAGKITAGTISADRIGARTITGQMLVIGTVDSTVIADGAITTSKITANSLNADRITSGTITTDKIGANQITGAKIAAGAISAGSAIIDTAAINSAQIGSLEVGKLTSGVLSAVITVSNRIQTSTGYPSVDITSSGLTFYGNGGSTTVSMDTQSGNASFNGDMVAKTWFSRNYVNGGGYIQIGNSSLNEDSNDELRFFVSNGAVALRSPTAWPGRFRISLRDSGYNTRVIDFDVTKGILANRFTMGGQFNTYPYMESYDAGPSGIWIRTVLEGGYNFYIGSVENSHTWIANDRVAISLLGSNLNQINFRNSSNTAYCNIQANTAYFSSLFVNGTQITGNGGGGNVNYANTAGYANEAGLARRVDSNTSQLFLGGGVASFGGDSVLIQNYGSSTYTRVQGGAGMYVAGAFAAADKRFLIPHPVDKDRWLTHGSTESPQSGVEYWGEVELDSNGQATVTLPTYFEALVKTENRSTFLTPIDEPSMGAASKIVDGKFVVKGPSNAKFSWLVKAERKGADFEVEPRVDSSETPEPAHLFDFPPDDQEQWRKAQEEASN